MDRRKRISLFLFVLYLFIFLLSLSFYKYVSHLHGYGKFENITRIENSTFDYMAFVDISKIKNETIYNTLPLNQPHGICGHNAKIDKTRVNNSFYVYWKCFNDTFLYKYGDVVAFGIY